MSEFSTTHCDMLYPGDDSTPADGCQCTLPPEHETDHEAGGTGGRVHHTWPITPEDIRMTDTEAVANAIANIARGGPRE